MELNRRFTHWSRSGDLSYDQGKANRPTTNRLEHPKLRFLKANIFPEYQFSVSTGNKEIWSAWQWSADIMLPAYRGRRRSFWIRNFVSIWRKANTRLTILCFNWVDHSNSSLATSTTKSLGTHANTRRNGEREANKRNEISRNDGKGGPSMPDRPIVLSVESIHSVGIILSNRIRSTGRRIRIKPKQQVETATSADASVTQSVGRAWAAAGLPANERVGDADWFLSRLVDRHSRSARSYREPLSLSPFFQGFHSTHSKYSYQLS